MKRKIYSLLFILSVFCVFVSAQTPRNENDPRNKVSDVRRSDFSFPQSLEEKLAEIDAYAEKVRADWNAPGFAIAIVKDDKLIFAKGYGVRELGKPEKVDENTLFAIASNTKAFTTASLAILIDEGKLKWDDHVSQYLPEFEMSDPYVTREMTIRDLVSHRSGLDTFSGDLLWYETTYSTDEILRRVRFLKPKSSFRSAYGYQNLMFTAAGRIVEKVSGKRWGEFVRERILKPLGMNRTTISVKELKNNYAMPHNESGGALRVLHIGNVDGAAPAAGLNSSVRDLSNWIRLQLGRGTFEGKKIFSRERSAEMWSAVTPLGVNPFPAKEAPTKLFSAVGMGWFLNDYRGRKMVSHTGGLDGMLSQTALLPEENLGLVVLTNSESGAYSVMVNKILDVFLDAAPKRDWSAERLERFKQNKAREAEEDRKIVAARAKNTKPSLALKDYAGTYTGELYGDATVTEENGRLVLRLVPAPNFVADLEHWHYDTFLIKWRPTVAYNFPRGFVTFTIDKTGRPDELKIDQPNNDFWFYELEFKRK
ncbi:MAG TPA: serine hydrolase [Pyrinomonadaceae bacterium]|jgi:CubicO group peptidase (beta-lactamase class C family)